MDGERHKETDTENRKGKKKDRQRRGEIVGQRNRTIDKGNKNINLYITFDVFICLHLTFLVINLL
jgi:hypothetical protein